MNINDRINRLEVLEDIMKNFIDYRKSLEELNSNSRPNEESKEDLDENINNLQQYFKEEFLLQLIGLGKYDAINLCKQANYQFNVAREDNDTYASNLNFRLDRINLQIDNDIVTGCYYS